MRVRAAGKAMKVLSRQWRRRLRWGETMIILTLLAAVLVIGTAYLIRAFYGYNPAGYRPFDLQRGQQSQSQAQSQGQSQSR